MERRVEHSKQCFSVMFCGAADGTFLPPMVVYRAENLYEGWTKNGPLGMINIYIIKGIMLYLPSTLERK